MNMSARHVITRRSAGHIYLPAIGGATGQEPWTPWRRARPKQQPPARSGGSKLFGRLDSHNYDRALVYKWAKRGDTYVRRSGNSRLGSPVWSSGGASCYACA